MTENKLLKAHYTILEYVKENPGLTKGRLRRDLSDKYSSEYIKRCIDDLEDHELIDIWGFGHEHRIYLAGVSPEK